MTKHKYSIEGMSCQSCVAKVKDAFSSIEGVGVISIDLKAIEAILEYDQRVDDAVLSQSLPSKYSIHAKDDHQMEKPSIPNHEKSKLEQLRPLVLILLYIAVASFLIHMKDLDISEMMIDFMGLFFIVFSFFKFLDVKGFANTFSMYDPIAKLISPYAYAYPFIETILGLMFLLRFNVNTALIATIVILGFTTYGVTKILLAKKTIQCACLGTALKLPMTEATFIENAIMIVMSLCMLFIM